MKEAKSLPETPLAKNVAAGPAKSALCRKDTTSLTVQVRMRSAGVLGSSCGICAAPCQAGEVNQSCKTLRSSESQ